MTGSDDDALLRAIAAAPPIEAPLTEGTRIGGFKIVSKLGAGGMGVVYRALDEELRREVALKIIAPGAHEDPLTRRRFLREARSAAAVSHPNVATVFEVGEDAGRIFIAMELVVGKPLRNLLAERKLDVEEALSIARQIARGLAKAHEVGIVHRDLKPDNVMVGEMVKVLDFGLARIEDKTADDASTETAQNVVAGTPGYMSPEQVTGGVVDARSDVFAFGIVLYEMLAGVRPFERDAKLATAVSIARDSHAPLSSKRRDAPAEIVRLVDRCLAKDPDRRPADARELVRELEISAAPRPRRSLLAPIAAGAIAVIGILVWRSRATDEPPTTRDPTTATSAAAPAISSSPIIAASAPPEPSVVVAPPPKPAVRPPEPPAPSASASAKKRDPLADQH